MNTRFVYSALLVLLAACTSDDSKENSSQNPSIARDYSAVNDFITSSNSETSTWSFRIKSGFTRDGNYALITDSGLQTFWNPATFCWVTNLDAGVGANNSGAPIKYVGNAYAFEWPDASIWLHPLQNGLTVVSWLSPRDGIVDIDYSFADIDANGLGLGATGINWFVELNDENGTLDSGTIAEGGAGSGALQLSNIAVKAGDRINFVVDPNGDYHFDSTALTANVSFVD